MTLAQARARAAEGRKLLDATPKIDPRSVWHAKPAEKPQPGEESGRAPRSPGRAPPRRQEPKTSRPMAQIARRPAEMVSQYAGRRDRPPRRSSKRLICFWAQTPHRRRACAVASPRCWDFARGPKDTHANPAAWSGWLKNKLGEPKKLGKRDRKTGKQIDLDNFNAMSYAEIPAFIQRLRAETSICARALEFLILTATRSGETRGARWSEIDFAARTWTIPGQRLKTGAKVKSSHPVPLGDRAIELLNGNAGD